MKKLVVFVLLCFPMMSFAAPSVKLLGNKTSGTPAATGARVTPAKATTSSGGSRIGALKQGVKTTAATTGTLSSGASSRFPVITPTQSYSSVAVPKPNSAPVTSKPSEEDIAEIADRIKSDLVDVYDEKIENFYTKDEIDGMADDIKSEIENEIESNYAKKTDLPDTKKYVEKADVYTKETVYKNDNFTTAVQEISTDDPRFDAVVYVAEQAESFNPAAKWAAKGKELPRGYVYMWVEK